MEYDPTKHVFPRTEYHSLILKALSAAIRENPRSVNHRVYFHEIYRRSGRNRYLYSVELKKAGDELAIATHNFIRREFDDRQKYHYVEIIRERRVASRTLAHEVEA